MRRMAAEYLEWTGSLASSSRLPKRSSRGQRLAGAAKQGIRQMLRPMLPNILTCLLLLVLPLPLVSGQDDAGNDPGADAAAKAQAELPEISDEPRAIDPSALLPAKLSAKATHDFSDSSLREVVAWLQDEQGIAVLLDTNALSEIGVSPAEPVSDRLDDAPIYLLLNRLGSMELAWYYDDDVLYITSEEAAENRTVTLPYNVGDLLDADYKMERLTEVIQTTIAPEAWNDVGGPGMLNALGDVLFVGQSGQYQRDVEALLTAFREHGRQTFVNDPPQHGEIRRKLEQNVSVEFVDTPLEAAAEQLAKNAKVDIRLDRPALRDARIREREPVTLKLADRKLRTVLDAFALEVQLTWMLRDGVLWITTGEYAETDPPIAVYDVRDLCRNEDESDALIEAITMQAQPETWDEVGGYGSIQAPKPGVLVVTQREQNHQLVLNLLETYRSALRNSKPRNRGEDTSEVTTVYYRMHSSVAADLAKLLPKLIRPQTWQGVDAEKEQPGELFLVASEPELTTAKNVQAKTEGPTQLIDRSVLIIRQTRAAHAEIRDLITRVENGDQPMSGMGGMGGFGGGFFALPPSRPDK